MILDIMTIYLFTGDKYRLFCYNEHKQVVVDKTDTKLSFISRDIDITRINYVSSDITTTTIRKTGIKINIDNLVKIENEHDLERCRPGYYAGFFDFHYDTLRYSPLVLVEITVDKKFLISPDNYSLANKSDNLYRDDLFKKRLASLYIMKDRIKLNKQNRYIEEI